MNTLNDEYNSSSSRELLLLLVVQSVTIVHSLYTTYYIPEEGNYKMLQYAYWEVMVGVCILGGDGWGTGRSWLEYWEVMVGVLGGHGWSTGRS